MDEVTNNGSKNGGAGGAAAQDLTAQRVEGVELFISTSLRWGVVISSAVILVGVVMLFVTGRTGFHPDNATHLANLLASVPGQPSFPITIADVFRGLAHFSSYSVIDLGLLILIATPVFRVAASVVAFAVERDRSYTIITSFVLAVLVLSFIIGKAE